MKNIEKTKSEKCRFRVSTPEFKRVNLSDIAKYPLAGAGEEGLASPKDVIGWPLTESKDATALSRDFPSILSNRKEPPQEPECSNP